MRIIDERRALVLIQLIGRADELFNQLRQGRVVSAAGTGAPAVIECVVDRVQFHIGQEVVERIYMAGRARVRVPLLVILLDTLREQIEALEYHRRILANRKQVLLRNRFVQFNVLVADCQNYLFRSLQ